MIKFPWNQLAEQRRFFCLSRSSVVVKADDFVYRIVEKPSIEERKILICIRNVIADECSCMPEILSPDDTCEQLNSLMGSEGILGFFFQPIKGFMGFDGKIFYYKLICHLKDSLGISYKIKIEDLPSLGYFGRYADYQIDSTMTLKQWAFRLKCEIQKVCSVTQSF